MIAIPNMDKPKNCYECPIAKSYLDCLMEKKYICPIGHTDDCPLIDIVQCKDCIWSYIDKQYGDTMWCKVHMSHYRVIADHFCKYGERRNE